MLLQRCTFIVIGSPAAAISNVEIAFADNVSSAAAVDSIRAAAAASLGLSTSSVTVTRLANGAVSVAISGTTLTVVQQQAALQQLQQGLASGSVTVAGLTVTGADTSSGTRSVLLQSCLLQQDSTPVTVVSSGHRSGPRLSSAFCLGEAFWNYILSFARS
jgi:hypothetical protein